MTNKYLVLMLFIVLAAFTGIANATEKNNSELNTSKKPENKSEKPINLTNETFKQKVFNYEVNKEWKYEGNLPCIIDFYASWCGPCKKIAPILDELAVEYDRKVIIYKVNTEKERELAKAFGISSIPALLFVPVKGQPQMAKGALSKEQFMKIIEQVLLKSE